MCISDHNPIAYGTLGFFNLTGGGEGAGPCHLEGNTSAL